MSFKLSLVDDNLRVSVRSKPANSFFKVALWTIVLIFLAQIVFVTSAGIFFGVQQGASYSSEAFDSWLMSLPVLLTIMIVAPIITIPLLIRATPRKSGTGYFDFWRLKALEKQVAVKWLLLAFVFWGATLLLEMIVNQQPEPFMLEMRAAVNNYSTLLLAIIAVCIVGPIMEELIFRGWLFSQLQLTKLGGIGALIVTTMVFTAVHSQYEYGISYLLVFLLGVLLGFIRYKSNNISYAIVVHMLFNTLSLLVLFLYY